MEQNATMAMPPANNNGRKQGKGSSVAVIIASIIAVCGVGFGAYGMIQGAKKDDLASNLKVQIEGRDGTITTIDSDKVKISDDSHTVTISESKDVRKNPIIKSNDKSLEYQLDLITPAYSIDGAYYRVNQTIVNGEMSSCGYYQLEEPTSYSSLGPIKECSGISGISGKIYKTAFAGKGQTAENDIAVFIMEDGTVKYASAKKMVEKISKGDSIAVEGTLSIDGFVTDAFRVSAREIDSETDEAGSGYETTIFVLSDGSYVEYNESMLK